MKPIPQERQHHLLRAPRWILAGLILATGCGLMIASLDSDGRSKLATDRLLSAACDGDLSAARAAWPMLKDDPIARHRASLTLLHVGATLGHANIVRQALAWGAAADARSPAGCTALMMAAGTSESVQIATILLDAGADPSAIDSRGATPLGNAVLAHDEGLVDVLLERGAM